MKLSKPQGGTAAPQASMSPYLSKTMLMAMSTATPAPSMPTSSSISRIPQSTTKRKGVDLLYDWYLSFIEIPSARKVHAPDSDIISIPKHHHKLLLGLVIGLFSSCLFLCLTLLIRGTSGCASEHHYKLTLPHHLTLSILSPFTSVVEHETTLLSTGALLCLVLPPVIWIIYRFYYHRVN